MAMNEHVLKIQVYQNQGGREENVGQEVMAMHAEGVDKEGVATGCAICLFGLFMFGWLCWGLVMALANDGCPQMTKFFYKYSAIFLVNFVLGKVIEALAK